MEQELKNLTETLRRLNEHNTTASSFSLLPNGTQNPSWEALIREINRTIEIGDARLRGEQKNLAIINGLIHSGMWSMEFDTAGNMARVTWSQAFRDMLGFVDEQDFPNVLSSWSDRLHPSDREPTLRAYWNAVKGCERYDVEYRMLPKSGGYKWFRATGEVTRRDDGTPDVFVGTFIDITHQKENRRLAKEKLAAEKEARQAKNELENQYDILTALCSDYLAVYRVNFITEKYEVYNISKYLRHHVQQITQQEPIYTTAMVHYARDFVTEEDRDDFLTMTEKAYVLRQLKRQKNFFIRYHVKENPQQLNCFEVHFADASKNGGPPIVVVGFRNVDAVIRQEEAYKLETQHDIEETLEGSRTGLWSIEMENGNPPRMYPDKTMRMLLGVEKNISPEKCYESWFSRIDPAYVDMVLESIDEMKKTGRAEVIYPWSHPVLGQIYIRCGGVPDHKAKGNLCRLKGYHQDITETMVTRKEQEKALLEALMQANEANRAKTEFLSHMSHDIRTPINGILGMLSISEKNPMDPVRQQECRTKIRAAAQHLLSLVNDVLDISKMESGSFSLGEEPFTLQDMLENCLAILRPQAEEEGLHLHVQVDPLDHPHLLGSPLHVRQILINIIGNAIKYNRPDGQITVQVTELPLDGEQALFRFTVTDTGIGMSEEFQKKLFQPFTQENNNVRTHYTGTGLGMAITKRLVEKMNGTITAESRLGEGSRFTVTLPFTIDKKACCHKEASESEAAICVKGLHLLLVEDNELNREIAQYMLEDAGAVVENAVNGQEAVDRFASCPAGTYDAILMDVMMPVMDGLQATRTIRAMDRPDARTIPILAMTANAFAEDVQKVKEAGMNEHLAKPLDMKKVLQVITAYCRKPK